MSGIGPRMSFHATHRHALLPWLFAPMPAATMLTNPTRSPERSVFHTSFLLVVQ